MVIGIDAREAQGRPAGKGRFIQELLHRLPEAAPKDHFELYVQTKPLEADQPSNVSWHEVGGPGPLWHARVARQANQRCDVYLASTSYITPQLLRIPYVLIVYDLITFQDFAIPQKRAKRIERATLARAAKRATSVITISEASKQDLTVRYPDTANKTQVISPAADPRFTANHKPDELARVREKYELPSTFILTTGTIEPRKNLPRLIRAYGRLQPAQRRACPLVLVGKLGWEYDAVLAAKEAVGHEYVRHLDYVPDNDLAMLYAACTVFCYPSLYEGFGLPVLEAMQSGAPVIISSISSLPEVGGEAARYIDPHQTGQIETALRAVLANKQLRLDMSAASLRQAKRFSWGQTARQVLEVIHAR